MSTEQDGIRRTSGQRALRRPADDIIGKPNLRVKTAGRPAHGMAPRPVVLAPAAAAAAIASAPTAGARVAPAAHAAPVATTTKEATAVAPAAASAEGPVAAPAASAAPAVTERAAASEDSAAAATIVVERVPEAEAPVVSAAPKGADTRADAAAQTVVEEPVVTAAAEPEQMMGEAPRKTSKLPRLEPKRVPSLFATHRPAPPDEEAEKAQLAALTGQKAKAQDRQVSTGFLLGAALIVMLLVGGVVIARMDKHVRGLEARVSSLEQPHLRAVAVAPRQR